MLVFDIETDGLLPELSVIHCINVIDRSTGKRLAFNGGEYTDGTPAQRDGTIEDGVRLLNEADLIAGHKIIWYDIPAIKKLFPWFNPKGIFDSLTISRVIWTDLTDRDFNCLRKGLLPHDFQARGLINSHSLEAWGWRLGEYKGDFDPTKIPNPGTGENYTWANIGFTQDMDVYGRQDVEVTLKLIKKIEEKNYSQECIELETIVDQIIFRQHARGFAFDQKEADALIAKLQRRHAEISGELQKVFQPWWCPDLKKGSALFTPKGNNKKMGYTAGASLSKVKLVVFNPGSRDHIADRLKKLYGWEPAEFTDGGKPKIDESTMEPLPWPEAKLLLEYLLVEKRLGQIATGEKAWLVFAVKTGIYGRETDGVLRIHGSVVTNGCVTGRMSHVMPNIAQTPKVGVPYGEECRSCFMASPGLVLVGCDAEGIELRCLAHFMAIYDNGAYAEAVVNGRKENETDVHNVNKRAIGLNKRDNSKTFIYALIYGAGDYKLGTIVYDDFTEDQKAKFNAQFVTAKNPSRARDAGLKSLGKRRRARLMENLPALQKLSEAVKAAVKARGYLKGLDGRLLHIRAEHAALNTLLQSAGAVLMKKALVIFERDVVAPIRSTGGVVEMVANVHDEFQIETEEQHAETIGKGAADCIRKAGEYFKFRCPLAGSYSIGANWRATH